MPTDGGYHLAQLNVARLLAPLDTPVLAGFVAALEPVNALADGTTGFVWRLQTEDGDATSIRAFDDDMVIVNMSVWQSLEHLREFVFRSDHAEVMRHRREWFSRAEAAYVVLWWIPAGSIPTVTDATARLAMLAERGPTPDAFTFRVPFPRPGSDPGPASDLDDRYSCSAD